MARLKFGSFLRGLIGLISARPRQPQSLADNRMLHTILHRRSIRKFKGDPIPADVWSAILEAGRLAPSTVNMQTWSFVTFTAAEWRDLFEKRIPFDAPGAIMILADAHRAGRVVEGFPYAPLCRYTVGVANASLAAMNITLAAEALGVSSVMLSETGQTGFYDSAYLAERLNLPPGVVPVMTIALGYGKSAAPAIPPKLPLEAVAFSGKYRETDTAVLDEWYLQMRAGYQAGHKGEDFSAKIRHYNRRLDEAEADLRRRVFYEGE